MDGYALSRERPALLAIHPDGTVTGFAWRDAPGFARISAPQSIFVGRDRVYALVSAERDSVQPSHAARFPLVLIFDRSGALAGTVILEHTLNPLVLGVFPSGNLVLGSEDRLNHRMALNLVGADGIPIRELRLYGNDFIVRAAEMPAAPRGTSSYSSLLLVSISKFFASGDHLLLVPLATSGLPVVELDERGVIHSVTPQTPDDMVAEDFIPSNNRSGLKMRLATVLASDKGPVDSEGKLLGVALRPSARIAEFSRTDGRLLQEEDMGSSEIQPACETDETLRFLTLRADHAHLQVGTARAR